MKAKAPGLRHFSMEAVPNRDHTQSPLNQSWALNNAYPRATHLPRRAEGFWLVPVSMGVVDQKMLSGCFDPRHFSSVQLAAGQRRMAIRRRNLKTMCVTWQRVHSWDPAGQYWAERASCKKYSFRIIKQKRNLKWEEQKVTSTSVPLC